MSLFLRFLNPYLRLTEKRSLRRAKSETAARRSFERKARMGFFAPRGVRFDAVTLGGVPALNFTPEQASDGPVILYFHGGAYVIGSPRTHRAMLATLAQNVNGTAILPDYRLAPEHSFPAPFEDAVAAYRGLLESGVDPKRIVLGGDSAGGGLVLALLGEICRAGLPKPRGCFAFSPWTDLTLSGPSITTNAKAEVILPVERLEETAQKVLNGADPRDARISPLFGDFPKAPPVWITAGSTEILLDDTTRMVRHLVDQGGEVTDVIETDLPHVWPLFHNWLSEATDTLDGLATWIKALSDPD